MKRLSSMVALFLILLPPSALAIQYCIDYLEYQNPGGWENGLKTCDQSMSVTAGSYLNLADVWINDVSEPLITAGFWLEYNPACVDILALLAYDGTILSGPWSAAWTSIVADPDGPGTYFTATANTDPHVQPDDGGDIIIARIQFECTSYCSTTIKISTVPGFDTVVGESLTIYDPSISSITIPLSCSATDYDDDGFQDFMDNCYRKPNGLLRGSCTLASTGGLCMQNADCGTNGFCSRNQEDTDSDHSGDACDDDDDNDQVPDLLDNCLVAHNTLQQDTYPPQGNGIGDSCECEGNFNCSVDQDVDGSDAATFKIDFGRSTFQRPCVSTDTCNGDFSCDGDVDGTDAALFKQDFGRSTFENPCPACAAGTPWCQYN